MNNPSRVLSIHNRMLNQLSHALNVYTEVDIYIAKIHNICFC